MQENFEINAVARSATGTSSSRRSRHTGVIPGIIYGGSDAPTMIELNRNELIWHLGHDEFYSHPLTVKMDDGNTIQVTLKDLQCHPANSQPLHVDFMRISA